MRLSSFSSGLWLSVFLFVTGCSDTHVLNEPAQIAVEPVNLGSKLSAADKLDGKEDRIVDRCFVCELGMDGSPDHTVRFQDYEVHLCSEHCRSHFKEHAEQVVTQTKIPIDKPK